MTINGIWNSPITGTPITVVDTETTGLYPGGDRVIEIAVVRADPGAAPKVMVDTLINPKRSVAATEIHGISDEDVADAPTFEDVAPAIVDALCGSVFASYNVYFDSRFMREELKRVGVDDFPPHLCLMYLRPMLGLGRKCSLRDACAHSGIAHRDAHHALADAMAAVALWSGYLEACAKSGVKTFGELAQLRDYKFTDSFSHEMLDDADRLTHRAPITMKSRSGVRSQAPSSTRLEPSDRQPVLSAYWDALTASLSDLDITPYEVFYLKAKQTALGVRPNELRWLHARAFSGILADLCQDKSITDAEATALSRVAAALRELGWSPGDEPALAIV